MQYSGVLDHDNDDNDYDYYMLQEFEVLFSYMLSLKMLQLSEMRGFRVFKR